MPAEKLTCEIFLEFLERYGLTNHPEVHIYHHEPCGECTVYLHEFAFRFNKNGILRDCGT
jgi:hypothetical protein